MAEQGIVGVDLDGSRVSMSDAYCPAVFQCAATAERQEKCQRRLVLLVMLLFVHQLRRDYMQTVLSMASKVRQTCSWSKRNDLWLKGERAI